MGGGDKAVKHELSRKVYDHLEFLGYKLETEDLKDEYDTYLGRHETRANLYVRSSATAAYVRSFWRGVDARALKAKDFYVKLNEINADSLVVACYYTVGEDGKVGLAFSATCFGYEKSGFGAFVDTFEAETRRGVQALVDFMKK